MGTALPITGRPSLAQLNDAFRRTLVGGRVVVTPGVVALGQDQVLSIMCKVATRLPLKPLWYWLGAFAIYVIWTGTLYA